MLNLTLVFAIPFAHATGIPLSAGGASIQFDDADFNLPVRYDQGTQFTQSACADSDDLMITGLTRVTGQVSCIKKTAANCPKGTFAESLRANLSYPPRLDYTCRPVVRATCPTDYVWQSINLGALDPGPAGSPALNCASVGTCVYRWANNIPWQRNIPDGHSSVSGAVCNPQVYSAVPSGPCVAHKVLSIAGTCYKPCPPCNHHGCSTCAYPQEPSVSTTYSVSGATVSCQIVKDEQCGGYVSAYISWGGTCVINAAENASPQGACTP